MFSASVAHPAPFDEQIEFKQPDGTVIRLHGRGDEFSAIFETLDGFTAVYDQAKRAYCYAQQARSGELLSTGAPVHSSNPAALGLSRHERMSFEARKRQVVARWQRWEQGMQVEAQWKARKEALRAEISPDGSSGEPPPPESAPPSFATVGTKVGLTLLVDISDDPATIPQAEIVNFCNGDAYAGYGLAHLARNMREWIGLLA